MVEYICVLDLVTCFNFNAHAKHDFRLAYLLRVVVRIALLIKIKVQTLEI